MPVNDAAVSRPSARVSAASPSAGASPAAPPSAARRVGAAGSPPRRRCRATAALLLSACGDSRPGTAAVVGDQRITDGDLQSLVNESLSAPGVRAALPNSDYKGDIGAYRRAVLNVEVERLLAENGARRLGIAIDENAVDARYKSIEDQSGGPDRSPRSSPPGSRCPRRSTGSSCAPRSSSPRSAIPQGKVKRPTDAQLQALYQQYLPTATTATLSLIQVPSQAIADQAAAALKSDPSQFAAVAAQLRRVRLADLAAAARSTPLSRLPPDLVATLQKTPKNEIFSYSLANGGAKAFFVIRFGGIETPSLEEARPQLEAQTLQQATAAGQKYLERRRRRPRRRREPALRHVEAGPAGDHRLRQPGDQADAVAGADVRRHAPRSATGPSGGAGTQPSPTPSG